MNLTPLKRFVATAEKLREHPILASLRHGVMWSFLPVGLSMIPLYFFISTQQDWNLRVMDVYLASLGVMGPSCALFVAYFLSRYYGVRSFAGPVALAVYLSLLPAWPISMKITLELLRNTFTSGPFIGFFVAIALGGFVVFLRKRWPKIGFGAEGVALLVGLVVIAALRLQNIEIHQLIRITIARHISTADALSAALLIVSAMNVLWFWGLQGTAIIGSFITGVYIQLAYDNMQAAVTGQPLHLVTLPFLNYVFIGGAGTTLCLPFFMLFSRSKRLRILGGASLLPVLFNVNESLIYLMPLVLSTYFMIPFLLGPIFVAISTYYAMRWGWMPIFSFYFPGIYYLPSPIMAIVATTPGFKIPHSWHGFYHVLHLIMRSRSWRSGIVACVQIVFLTLFYYPFYRAFDHRTALEEKQALVSETIAPTNSLCSNKSRPI